MAGLEWVLAVWAIVGGWLVLWLSDAVSVAEGPIGRRPDPTACACCRHDAVAHRSERSGSGCTQRAGLAATSR